MPPRLFITSGLVPIFNPMTNIKITKAILMIQSNTLSILSGNPRQLIAAPIPRHIKGISELPIS